MSPQPPPASPRGIEPSPVRSDINVTPLVDVCLVLLIIFMVVTPMIGKGKLVKLPETRRPQAIEETRDQLTLTIAADGQIFVSEALVPRDGLARLLQGLHEQSPDREVRVRGAETLAYRDVRDVLKALNEAGFTKAGIVTLRKPAAG